uniref:Solute carrier family 2, facilitated glucose transporter member 10 n=1 Tax=Leptobrachium leishanense TaxID=445787 RepID=A0A8C5MSZ5_9ANUR
MGTTSALLILSAAVSMLGGLIFGYELGIISGALLQLKKQFYLTCFQQEALVCSLLFGAFLSSLFGGFLIDRCGRRTSILASNVVVLVGSLILVLANSFLWLVLGRIITGIAISLSSMACCIYVSEIVLPHQRGKLVSLYETGVTLGILLSYAVNYLLANVNEGWKYMFGLAITPALAQFISILFLPSKPSKPNSWNQETDNDFIQMKDIMDEGKPAQQKREYSFCDLFSRKDNMRARTFVGLGLVLFQQLTGQPNVLNYASTIFHTVGFQSNSSAILASVGLGLAKVLSTLVALGCADKAGRRILLIAGCIVMTLSVIGIGLLSFNLDLGAHENCTALLKPNSSHDLSNSSEFIGGMAESLDLEYKTAQRSRLLTKDHSVEAGVTGNHLSSITPSSNTWDINDPLQPRKEHVERTTSQPLFNEYIVLNWLTLLSMMTFVCAFSIGFGPMTWLVLTEIFPEEIRGRAFAFCNTLNWSAMMLISLSFLDTVDAIGLSWTFLVYGMMGILAIIFIYLFIPETKGKSLEEIDKEFSTNRSLHGSVCAGLLNRIQRRRGAYSL